MNEPIQKFKELINDSKKILIITHVGPDPDAFTSLLLMGTTLELNYPDKQIVMSSEERTGGLKFLDGYKKIKIQPLVRAINNHQPDLIILVDAMNFSRATRGDTRQIADMVKQNGIKLAIIDHHEPVGVEDNDSYINQGSPAAVQDVYEVLFDHLNLQKPTGFAQTTLLGLYSDSGGFVYENPRYRQTFKLVGDLIDAGAKIETIHNLLQRFSAETMSAIAELANNLGHGDDYSYSFISDKFTNKWQKTAIEFDELKLGVAHFVNDYIRNIDGRDWGFVIYKDLPAGDDIYGVSLRSVGGSKNVAKIAESLGGGGHIPSAGAKIKASSAQEALAQVRSAIEQMK